MRGSTRARNSANDSGSSGQWVERHEGAQIGGPRFPVEHEGVALDAVEQSGRQALADVRLTGFEVFGQNRRGGTVVRAQIAIGDFDRLHARVVVDDDVGVRQSFAEVCRLDVEKSDAGKAAQGLRINDLDADVEQSQHGQVFRPGRLTESEQRRRRAVAPQHRAQGNGAGDTIWIRVVLQQ
jgi:hypothetical protein